MNTLSESAQVTQPHPYLQISDVEKSFREGEIRRQVLAQANLEVEQGSFVAILGRSGSGKSTLLNLICGIDDPDGGEIRLTGRSITNLSEYERTLLRREEMGFIFQFFHLIPTLTAAENLALPLELNGVDGADIEKRVQQWLAAVGLEDRGDSYPDILSGGEQQRIALARALIHNPKLLLADEPTGNLDSDSAALVLKLIKTLSRERQTTVIMATHSREAAAIADRVLHIKEGRLDG